MACNKIAKAKAWLLSCIKTFETIKTVAAWYGPIPPGADGKLNAIDEKMSKNNASVWVRFNPIALIPKMVIK